MPSKKKKYNARFPAGRIKKIMQSDEEIGKVAQAVPVIISRTLELFVESLLTKTLKITNARNAKTLSTSHMKQCIMSEQRFDFLRELVKNIPDISVAEDEAAQSSPEEQYPDSDTPYDLSMPSTSTQASQQRSNHALTTTTNGVGLAAAGGGDIVNYCKRSTSNTSVIMYTTTIANASSIVNNNESLLPKLVRSDSTPAQLPASTTVSSKGIWRPVETSPTTPRKRLKQQSPNAIASNQQNNNNNNNSNTPTKQTQKDSPLFHPQPAIPPPIVNFDFCTKPVVKIDYSNLSLTTTKTCTTTVATATAPLSAPVIGHHHHHNNNNNNSVPNSSAFDFSSTAPIINIDLSNLMTTTATATPNSSQTTPIINGPAVATISIGALPLTTSATAEQPTTTANPLASTKTNALFELDEDYDNI